MKKRILSILMSLISCFCAAQTDSDNDAVKKVIYAFQDDFNDGSFRNAHLYATTDWVHIHPGGGITRGRDEVLREVIDVHQSFLKGVSMIVEKMEIRFVNPTVAVAVVLHKISPYELPAGVMHENERQIKTYIVIKQKGKWLLSHDHNTVVQGSKIAENKD
jgi:uncharacterized protein (TIGR02246 family)